MHVWHGRTFRWGVSPSIRGEALLAALTEGSTRSLLRRIHAGHSVEWDGNNRVGRLTQDAEDASHELERKLERLSDDPENLAEVWDVEEWLWNHNHLADNWPERESLDEAVERLEKEVEAQPRLVIAGDFRNALLTRAQWYFEKGQHPIGLVHLDALLADGRITEDERSEYMEEHEISDRAGDQQAPR